MKDIQAGLIRRVIVYRLDRISRPIVDFAKLMELFKQYNVEFVSCTEKFDISTPMGRAPYGFDTEPTVMDGIKTKRLIETAEMEHAELMYEMYAEPETSYGDITWYFTENEIQVYGKTLKRGFVAQLLRNPLYVKADMDIYKHFKA